MSYGNFATRKLSQINAQTLHNTIKRRGMSYVTHPLYNNTNHMKTYQAIVLALATAGSMHAATFWGVTDTNNLVSFDSAAPGTFLSSVTITGLFASDGVTLDPNAVITNLSYNPNTRQFLGIDSNANIYRVGVNGTTTLLNSTFSPGGFDAGIAYDPFSGGFLYADDAADRFNLSTAGAASLVGSASYGVGDVNEAFTPSLMGVGIDPDFGSAFFLDVSRGSLAQSFDPDALELFTVGSLGIVFTGYGDLAFDLDGNLLASLSTDGLSSDLYSIDQTTGAATLIGSFSQGVGTIAIPEPSSALLGAIGALALMRRRRL
jgi:hypothetical protein